MPSRALPLAGPELFEIDHHRPHPRAFTRPSLTRFLATNDRATSVNGLSAPTPSTDIALEAIDCQCGVTEPVSTPSIVTPDADHVQCSQADRRRRVLVVPGCCYPKDPTRHRTRLCLISMEGQHVSRTSHRSTEQIEIRILRNSLDSPAGSTLPDTASSKATLKSATAATRLTDGTGAGQLWRQRVDSLEVSRRSPTPLAPISP